MYLEQFGSILQKTVIMEQKDIELVKSSFHAIEANSKEFIRVFYSRLFDMDTNRERYFKGELAERKNELISIVHQGMLKLDNEEQLGADLEKMGLFLKNAGVPLSSYSTIGVCFIDGLAAVLEYHNLSQATTNAWAKVLKYFFSKIEEVYA